MGQRTGEGTGTHPTPSELRACNNHPGQSTKERSAAEARIPGGIDGTLGAGRVYDSWRSSVAVNASFCDVVICHPTDTLHDFVQVPVVTSSVHHLAVLVCHADAYLHLFRSPSRHALRRSQCVYLLNTVDRHQADIQMVRMRMDHG